MPFWVVFFLLLFFSPTWAFAIVSVPGHFSPPQQDRSCTSTCGAGWEDKHTWSINACALIWKEKPAALGDILRCSCSNLRHGAPEKAFANLPGWHIMQFRHSFVKGIEMIFDKVSHACECNFLMTRNCLFEELHSSTNGTSWIMCTFDWSRVSYANKTNKI